MGDPPPIEDTIDWLYDRRDYQKRIVHQENVSGQEATTSQCAIETPVAMSLMQHGIEDLYQHQVQAIRTVREGQNVVVATPTASGKSLTYIIPALERAIDRGTKTLYIAPFRALINDQADTFREFADELGYGASVDVGVQTGDTSSEERRRIKDSQTDVLLMTLDQIHYSLLPYAHSRSNWRWLFQQLETIVVDEVHMYRGVFGSHASLVFRRLNRLCDYYDADPDYICCSATIGNPVEHAAAVAGRPEDSFTLVDEDTSASGDRHWLLWNPPLTKESRRKAAANQSTERADGGTTTGASDNVVAMPDHGEVAGGERKSHHIETVGLFCDLVEKGYQTLVFTSSRQGAEQYAEQCDRQLTSRGKSDLGRAVHAYHSALDTDRRRTLEKGLRNGDVRGVWSTKALELGIDVGTLDVVLLDGYPGTTMSTFQRAGRAGRGEDSCLVVLVGSDNPLDQYVLRDPDQLFEGGAERAAVNPRNDAIRPDHVVCGAEELYLRPEKDKAYFGEDLPEIVTEELENDRLESVDGPNVRWDATNDNIQWQTTVRPMDDRSIALVDTASNETLGDLDYAAALRDAFPGAIYHHQKRTFEVEELDVQERRAMLKERDTNEYTRALREKDVEIEGVERETTINAGSYTISCGLGTLTVSDTVTSYLHFDHPGDDDPLVRQIEGYVPTHEIETTGFYLWFPRSLKQAVTGVGEEAEEEFLDGLHALEHAMISLFPTEVLCDRSDVGGLSTVDHTAGAGGTVFIHDGYDGGAGLTRQAFDRLETLLAKTQDMIQDCECVDGCPSCVHSPHCGNANRNLDKGLALEILSHLSF